MTGWRVVPLGQLDELAGPWNELWGTAGSPLADHAWLSAWVDAFGAPAGAAVHARFEGDRLLAAVPLQREGRRGRTWGTLENEHWPHWLCPWPAPDPDAAGELLEHLWRGTDYLFLRRLHQDGPVARALLAAARRRRLPHSLLEHPQRDAVIELGPSWAELESRLSKNLVRDTPRKRRRLERMGRLELAWLDAPGPPLDQALQDCFELETRGWKGQTGSPILARPDTLRFYRQAAAHLAATGRFILYLLRLGGRVIAFEYCLRGGGHIEMLKLSFDPDLARDSPGNVLRMMLLEREIAAGQVHTYHLGRSSEWKLRWATRAAPLSTLRIYAPSLRGRAASLGPALRAGVKGSPALARVLHRARRLGGAAALRSLAAGVPTGRRPGPGAGT